MKFNRIVLLCISLSFCSYYFGQKNNKLKAYFDYKQYFSPVDKNYVEFQLQFVGHTAKYIDSDSGLVATINISYKIKNGDSLLKSDNYLLQSPKITDSIFDNFYEVKRFKLDPGIYTLELNISDINNSQSRIVSNQSFEITDLGTGVNSSDILIAEVASFTEENSAFNKSGIHIVPFISTYFPEELIKIPYYFEIYNTNTLDDSLVAFVQKITNLDNNMAMEEFTFAEKLKTDPVIPIFKSIEIADLKTGRYKLELIVLDKSLNELSKSTYEFERSNSLSENENIEQIALDPAFQKSIHVDSVDFYLASLLPIANPAESKNIIQTLKAKNEDKSRKHIQSFWNLTSKKNSSNAYEEWMKYKQQVLMVERLYRTNFQSGHETDRGRVYLKYGAPSNVVSKEVSPSEYPYEIWTYNKISIYSNKRFLFYNPDLVNNAFRLLHSDMLGERKTPGWAQVLSKRNTNQGDVDNPNKYLSPSIGNNSQDLFRQY